MLGVSGLLSSSGDGAAASEAHKQGPSGGGGGEMNGAGPSTGGFSEEDKGRVEEGDRSSAGNRWPKQETLALLKIRSDMDVAFRDSSLKGPLWDKVSRKLAELGYHRSAKKCKEKFENVYKYHKRTKEGRASKADGKNYPFFDQLEALENHPSHPLPPPSKPQISATAMTTAAMVAIPETNPPFASQLSTSTVPSTTNPITVSQNTVTPSTINSTNPLPQPPPPPPPPTAATTTTNPKILHQSNVIRSLHPNVMLNSTSSSTSSDLEPRRRLRRKRKWEDLLKRVMEEVIHKQEELQRKFLEALEKRERDRMEREEAWRVQEMARMNREHELLVQERSMTAAKDASLIAFLQKISQQQQQNPNLSQMQVQVQEHPLPPSPPRQPPPPPLSPPTLDNRKTENFTPNNSSRWPKPEVEALIRLRSELDLKYQENGPKGPLWEEMSMAMRKLGYDRSSKRCKEKWENINKYFKKVKESNKKRPEDSKTCPYFHQLEALYREKNKTDASFNHGSALKIENPMAPIMVRPEQQWPLPAPVMEDRESENVDQNNDDDEDMDDEEEDGGGGYEIVTNKASSVATVE